MLRPIKVSRDCQWIVSVSSTVHNGASGAAMAVTIGLTITITPNIEVIGVVRALQSFVSA